jgi:hypothetical protein
MSEPESDPNSNSLQPQETDRVLAGEVDALSKGSGLRLVWLGLGVAAVVAVAVAVLGNLDNRQAFVDAGAKVAALNEGHFEAFWNCALINMNQAQIKSADDLQFQLQRRAEHFGRPYAGTLQTCGASLDSLERELSTLSVPEPLRSATHAMEKATADQRHALQDFVATVSAGGPQYQPGAAKPALAKLAQGWQAFGKAHTAFTDALRERL